MTLFDMANSLYEPIEQVRTLQPGPKYEEAVTELADTAEELADAVTDERPLRERLRDVLRDGNGLPPTNAMADVLIAVLFAADRTDEKWSERGFPGVPSTTDYAAGVVKFLELRYPIRGALL